MAVAELSDSEVKSGSAVDAELPVSNATSGSGVDDEPPASSASGSVAGVVAPDGGFVTDELSPDSAAISGSLPVTAFDDEVSPTAASRADFQDWAALEAAEGALAGDGLWAAIACWTASGLGVPPMGLTDMGLQASKEVILVVGRKRPDVERLGTESFLSARAAARR